MTLVSISRRHRQLLSMNHCHAAQPWDPHCTLWERHVLGLHNTTLPTRASDWAVLCLRPRYSELCSEKKRLLNPASVAENIPPQSSTCSQHTMDPSFSFSPEKNFSSTSVASHPQLETVSSTGSLQGASSLSKRRGFIISAGEAPW